MSNIFKYSRALQLKNRYPISNKTLWVVTALSMVPLLLSVYVLLDSENSIRFLNISPISISSFWTIFGIATASFTAMLAYADYKIRKNLSIVFYGITALISASLDFNYLLLIQDTGRADATSFISTIWALNFLFFAISVLISSLIFFKVKTENLRTPNYKTKIIKWILLGNALLGLTILLITTFIKNNTVVNQQPFRWISFLSLTVILIWGLKYARNLARKLPNVFLKHLALAVVPLSLSQVLLFASQTPFDFFFNVANYLKCIAYLIPLTGIIINYIHALENEQKVISKLDIEIKEKQKLTNYLLEREELLANAEKISKLGSWVFDVKHQAYTWSNQLYEIYGVTDTSIQPTHQLLKQIILPSYWNKFEKELQTAVTNKTSFAVEYRISLPNGNKRFLLAQGYFSPKEKQLLGTVQDITELKEATLKLQKNETLLREGEAVANNGSWEWTSNDDAIFWSDEMFNIHGHLPHSIFVTIKTYRELVYPKDLEQVKTTFFEALKQKKSFQVSYRIVRPNGEIRHVTTTGKFRTDDLGNGFSFLGNTQDVSILKETERKLEDKINELNVSNKDLEQFAYVASHDLQEPLRKIRAFGDRLKTKYSGEIPEEGKDYIERMQNASERMQILIDDLLSFSRVSRQEKTFEKVVLDAVIQKAIQNLEYAVEKSKVSIEINVPETIDGIASLLVQVFQNLLSNSIKFRKPEGQSVIKVSSQVAFGSELEVLTASKNQLYCVIKIADNGIGFDDNYSNKIFELFQRLHARTEYKGTGIGLAVCKKIVERHSGFIYAKSKEGDGASFFIALPINQA